MRDEAADQKASFAAAIAVQLEGRDRAEVCACIAERSGESMTTAALGHWLNGAVEPTRAKLYAAEECFGLKPGTLTACFGYVPTSVKPARSVPDAIASDGTLDERARSALLALYRELARR